MKKKDYLYHFDDRFKQLIKRDNTNLSDVERKSLFYIIAGNDDLYSKIDFIYDFTDRRIKPDCLDNEDVDFCSSSRKLINLAFNLFNGYPADVLNTFSVLDEDNFTLAINAMKIRFKGID